MERTHRYQKTTGSSEDSKELRVKTLTRELRQHARFFGDYALCSKNWFRLEMSLRQIAAVAFHQRRKLRKKQRLKKNDSRSQLERMKQIFVEGVDRASPPRDSSGGGAMRVTGTGTHNTLWDQEEDEIAVRVFMEEGKLNLALRVLHDLARDLRNRGKMRRVIERYLARVKTVTHACRQLSDRYFQRRDGRRRDFGAQDQDDESRRSDLYVRLPTFSAKAVEEIKVVASGLILNYRYTNPKGVSSRQLLLFGSPLPSAKTPEIADPGKLLLPTTQSVLESMVRFEENLGLMLKYLLSHTECVQVLDIPQLLQHCTETLHYAYTGQLSKDVVDGGESGRFEQKSQTTSQKKRRKNPDSLGQQTALVFHYLSSLGFAIDDLDEDRIMDLVAEHKLIELSMKHMYKHYFWYDQETLVLCALFWNAMLNTEAFMTEEERFIKGTREKKYLVGNMSTWVELCAERGWVQEREIRTLLDVSRRYMRVVGRPRAPKSKSATRKKSGSSHMPAKRGGDGSKGVVDQKQSGTQMGRMPVIPAPCGLEPSQRSESPSVHVQRDQTTTTASSPSDTSRAQAQELPDDHVKLPGDSFSVGQDELGQRNMSEPGEALVQTRAGPSALHDQGDDQSRSVAGPGGTEAQQTHTSSLETIPPPSFGADQPPTLPPTTPPRTAVPPLRPFQSPQPSSGGPPSIPPPVFSLARAPGLQSPSGPPWPAVDGIMSPTRLGTGTVTEGSGLPSTSSEEHGRKGAGGQRGQVLGNRGLGLPLTSKRHGSASADAGDKANGGRAAPEKPRASPLPSLASLTRK